MNEIPNNLNTKSKAWLQDRDISLAACLASFAECKFYEGNGFPIEAFEENGEKFYVFKFEPNDKTKELWALWKMPLDELLTKYPEHPVSYIRSYHYNRNRLLDAIKKLPYHTIVKKNNKIYLIANNVNPENQENNNPTK